MRQRFVVEILDDEEQALQTEVPESLDSKLSDDVFHHDESSSQLEAHSRGRVTTEFVPQEESPQPTELQVSTSPEGVSPDTFVSEDFQSTSIPKHQLQREPEEDMFSSRQEQVQSLLQESQLEDAQQEAPHIEVPAVPKRKQRELHQSARETAFQNQFQSSPLPKTKIEKFYQKQPEYVEQKAVEKQQHTPFWKKIRVPRRVGRGWLVGAVVTLLVLATGIGSAVFIHQDLKNTQDHVENLVIDLQAGQMLSARERVEILRRKQERYSTLYEWGRGPISLVAGEQKTIHLDKLLRISDSGLSVVENGLSTYDLLQMGYQQFLGNDTGDAVETLAQVSGELEAVFTDLSSLQAELQQLDNPFDIALIDEVKQEVNESFPEARRAVLAAQQISYALPQLLGETGKKQYLVLLQNNEELRPTGGFIGSFGILTVEQGRFVDFRVEDVYEADGQLQGFVTPPEEIVEHLGEAQWFLRDVNWSPDFPTVAQQAGWFLDKEIGIEPDGVIGINLHVAQKLLEVTGPIRLVDYDEIITRDNLYERAEMHSEINFFPGSTQKRDFLSAVANQLFEKLMQSDTNTLAVMRAFYQSAEEAEMLIALDDPQAMSAFQNLGWTGALLQPGCPPPFENEGCFVDTVMQVEANMGVNKANQYIDRAISHDTIVGKEQVKHEREIVFINRADSNAWPEGAYKNYMRLFVPENASLQTVHIDGAVLDASSVREKVEHGRRSIGFLVNVPIRSEVHVRVEYTVPVPVDQRSVYALFEQKQSGTTNNTVEHSIEVLGRDVLTVAPEPIIEGRTLQFISDRVTHQFMAVEMR